MRTDLLEILVCPMCKGELALNGTEEADGEIVTGTLRCLQCAATFPIEDGIPNLIPPDMRD
ncbi:hypothetical protein AYO38_09945 [bacterium SCGC AG-212-C10]|nr:hypothetical protein AYO38_09945 [bacterium SCGC AG-212-C10]